MKRDLDSSGLVKNKSRFFLYIDIFDNNKGNWIEGVNWFKWFDTLKGYDLWPDKKDERTSRKDRRLRRPDCPVTKYDVSVDLHTYTHTETTHGEGLDRPPLYFRENLSRTLTKPSLSRREPMRPLFFIIIK